MRLDPELARTILAKVAELPFDGGPHDIGVEGKSAEEVAYHVMLLHQRGLLDACDASTLDGPCWMPRYLTYEGNEFLSAAENEDLWNRAVTTVRTRIGTVTIEALKVVLAEIVRQLLTRP